MPVHASLSSAASILGWSRIGVNGLETKASSHGNAVVLAANLASATLGLVHVVSCWDVYRYVDERIISDASSSVVVSHGIRCTWMISQRICIRVTSWHVCDVLSLCCGCGTLCNAHWQSRRNTFLCGRIVVRKRSVSVDSTSSAFVDNPRREGFTLQVTLKAGVT